MIQGSLFNVGNEVPFVNSGTQSEKLNSMAIFELFGEDLTDSLVERFQTYSRALMRRSVFQGLKLKSQILTGANQSILVVMVNLMG